MTTVGAEIVQSAGNLHNKVREARFGAAKDILDNTTALHASESVFHHDTGARDDFVQPDIGDIQIAAARFFFGWWIMTPAGS